MKKNVPEKGDVISLSFDPQSGHEQRGRRPALVVSNTLFNARIGMAVVCPITNTCRNWPIHVAVPAGSKITGFIMTEQIKSIDYISRKAKFIEKANPGTLKEVLAMIDAFLYDSD